MFLYSPLLLVSLTASQHPSPHNSATALFSASRWILASAAPADSHAGPDDSQVSSLLGRALKHQPELSVVNAGHCSVVGELCLSQPATTQQQALAGYARYVNSSETSAPSAGVTLPAATFRSTVPPVNSDK